MILFCDDQCIYDFVRACVQQTVNLKAVFKRFSLITLVVYLHASGASPRNPNVYSLLYANSSSYIEH